EVGEAVLPRRALPASAPPRLSRLVARRDPPEHRPAPLALGGRRVRARQAALSAGHAAAARVPAAPGAAGARGSRAGARAEPPQHRPGAGQLPLPVSGLRPAVLDA